MNAFFRSWFSPMPNVGDRFLLDTENPFKCSGVTVVAIRRGWIQYIYDWGRDEKVTGELPRGSFHFAYRPENK